MSMCVYVAVDIQFICTSMCVYVASGNGAVVRFASQREEGKADLFSIIISI